MGMAMKPTPGDMLKVPAGIEFQNFNPYDGYLWFDDQIKVMVIWSEKLNMQHRTLVLINTKLFYFYCSNQEIDRWRYIQSSHPERK